MLPAIFIFMKKNQGLIENFILDKKITRTQTNINTHRNTHRHAYTPIYTIKKLKL